jgi:hypothetical protein
MIFLFKATAISIPIIIVKLRVLAVRITLLVNAFQKVSDSVKSHTKLSTPTNFKGAFGFSRLRLRTLSLSVRKSGYPIIRPISIKAGERNNHPKKPPEFDNFE